LESAIETRLRVVKGRG